MAEIFKKSDIEVLVATMHRTTLDFLKPMFPFAEVYDFSILIINQTTPDKLLKADNPQIRVVNSFEKGLSRSRNLALQHAKGKILLIADDDIVYCDDFTETVSGAFSEYPGATLITFRTLNGQGKLFKKYTKMGYSAISTFQKLGIMSVEMALNHQKAKMAGLRFDTRFGLGTDYPLGEEAVFVHQLQQKKHQLVMFPGVINIHPDNAGSETMDVIKKYFTLGAVYSAIFGKRYFYWIFIKLFFDCKQQKITLSQVYNLWKHATRGHKNFSSVNGKHDNT
ncbi:hypothetical protein CHU92_13985 [Flavobacterium cyanobacteriorum]|uniref:Glycosyltransferase 2-like domain-containing protein n=1 Tax=Flavobacterium cyanobacteriorum TaxID=2022802 RepID=A0A255YWJ2_9FLAO|nr:glycosyltransferase family A protein [Flavobacterium cyanobacteriorum]OYQ33025.1 hypothetical protein CHU92_13985 [Flavobacterium cyanobacteriorum]